MKVTVDGVEYDTDQVEIVFYSGVRAIINDDETIVLRDKNQYLSDGLVLDTESLFAVR